MKTIADKMNDQMGHAYSANLFNRCDRLMDRLEDMLRDARDEAEYALILIKEDGAPPAEIRKVKKILNNSDAAKIHKACMKLYGVKNSKFIY